MKYIFTIIFLLLFTFSYSQDIHFAHVRSMPTFLNPAMTGLFNGKTRISSNYRGQWNSFTKGYKTMAISGDMRAYELKNSIIGGGLSIYSDKAGDLNLSTNSISANASFIQLMGKDTWVSVGFQNSLTQSRIDLSEVKAFDQESNLNANSRTYWHLSTGLSLMHEFKNKSLVHFGAALFHVNNPNVSFFDSRLSNVEGGENLDRKLVLHGGADIKLYKGLNIRPNILFMDQGPHREITMGSFIKYSNNLVFMGDEKDIALYLGAWVRWYTEVNLSGGDALITTARLDFNSSAITVSYDINMSNLRAASYGQGGVEISFIKIMNKKRKRIGNQKLKCPADYF